MADAVALGIKPPQTMSLGDMVNLARGAQAYQQSEQANPLALQKAQIDIQKGGQEARTGQINLGVAEQADLERKNLQTFMADPKNWQNADGDVDINKINAEITKIAPLTGREHIEKLTTLAKSQTENLKATQDLTQTERAIIAGPLGVLGRMKIQDKNAYIQELDNQAKFHPDNKRIQRLVEAQKSLINQMPAGSDMASAGIRAMENLLNPTEAIAAFAPKPATFDTGGVIASGVTTPSVGGQAPTVVKGADIATKTPAPGVVTAADVTYQIRPDGSVVPLGQGGVNEPSSGSQFTNTGVAQPAMSPANVVPPTGQRPPVTAPSTQIAPTQPAPTGQTSSLVPLDMPVNTSGIVQLNTQQKQRYDEGKKIIKESSDVARVAGDSRQTIRQIRENIGEASGSRVGQVIRNAGKYVAGNEKLDELVKSLADNQLRQAEMMGIKTDAARDTSAKAYGSENITVGALNMIAGRAEAMNTAVEKYNAGLTKFSNKHGGYNGPIHAEKFREAWANNYDPLIFVIQDINSSQMSPMQKEMEIKKAKVGVSQQRLTQLRDKAETIKRLERGDF